MTHPACYLCGQSKACPKLFHKCQHESACYDCLRRRYIQGPSDASSYPLTCFHPECSRPLQTTQIQTLCQSQHELQKYHRLSHLAKVNVAKLGKHWQDVADVLKAFEGDLCRCPQCGFLILKDGGCDHMTCVCGHDFNWNQRRATLVDVTFMDKPIPKDHPSLKGPTKKQEGASKKQEKSNVLSYDENDVYEKEDETTTSASRSESSWEANGDPSSQQEDCRISDFGKGVAIPPEDSHPSITNVGERRPTRNDGDEESYELLDWPSFQSPTVDSSYSSRLSDHETWEELSDLSSVVSLDSRSGRSYLEAASSGNQAWTNHSTRPAQQLQPISENSSIDASNAKDREEDQDLDIYDSCFLYEGAKCARGGKPKHWYHHEKRRKYKRWHDHETKRIYFQS